MKFDEVQKHHTEGDCWIIISGHVYDISKYIEKHPGGRDKKGNKE